MTAAPLTGSSSSTSRERTRLPRGRRERAAPGLGLGRVAAGQGCGWGGEAARAVPSSIPKPPYSSQKNLVNARSRGRPGRDRRDDPGAALAHQSRSKGRGGRLSVAPEDAQAASASAVATSGTSPVSFRRGRRSGAFPNRESSQGDEGAFVVAEHYADRTAAGRSDDVKRLPGLRRDNRSGPVPQRGMRPAVAVQTTRKAAQVPDPLVAASSVGRAPPKRGSPEPRTSPQDARDGPTI